MSTVHVHVRVKDSTKKSAKRVLDKVGLDMSSAIKLYLNKIVITQTSPFRIVTENYRKEYGVINPEVYWAPMIIIIAGNIY